MIKLVPYDPEWADLYETAAAEIRGALDSTARSVDHVGSTAIPGMGGKAVIDILVVVEKHEPEAPYRDPLEQLGYSFHHRDDTHAFFEGLRDRVAYQVHVVEDAADDGRMMITFRDYLRSHSDEARRYEELKKRLAQQHSDGKVYADAKSSYVGEVVRRAESQDGGVIPAT